MTQITVRYFEGCPNWQVAVQRIQDAATGRDDVILDYDLVETPEHAERLDFVGSPTILINGADPFSEPRRPVGLTCRIYQTATGPTGSPTLAQIAQALEAAERS